jgi:hypothetical protein
VTRSCVAAVLFALALAGPAAAKEGVEALVTTPVPAGAEPGETLRVAWTLTFADGEERHPFNAVGVFVRLRSASGGAATTGFASPTAHADGRYDAQVAVPAGGIAAVEIGLRGTTDVLFPLRNDPLRAGGDSGSGSSSWVWPAAPVTLGVTLVLAVALALRRRRATARIAAA